MCAPSTGSVKLDQAGVVWFNEVRNVYLTAVSLPAAATSAQKDADARIRRFIDTATGDLTQQCLFDLEDLLIILLLPPDLKQWVEAKRVDYRETFGDDAWKTMVPALVQNVAAAPDADLQAEARRLQQELHWQYCVQSWANRQRRVLLEGILKVTVAVLAVLVVIYIICAWCGSRQIFLLLFLLGALGGCMSVLQRLQTTDLATARAMNNVRYAPGIISVMIAPLQGAIFSMLFVLALIAGVATQGFVIPDVLLEKPADHKASAAPAAEQSPGPDGLPGANSLPSVNSVSGTTTVAAANGAVGTVNGAPQPAKAKDRLSYPFFFMRMSFASGKDLALVLLWAFVAGFSERLVPDFLTRMAETNRS